MAIAELDPPSTSIISDEQNPPLHEGSTPPSPGPRESKPSPKSEERWYALPNGSETNRFFRHRFFRIIHGDNTADYAMMSNAPEKNHNTSGTQLLLATGINKRHERSWTSLTSEKGIDRAQGRLLARYLAIMRER
ncbi:MAG: hypothetical protein PHW10_04125 [Candidatus Peribacteraceae bacterium]|nr:hypothetical protein [Candidatus Peribacteraceae bacterium]